MEETVIYYNLINKKLGTVSKKLNQIFQWITHEINETKNVSNDDSLQKEYDVVKSQIAVSDMLVDINFTLDKFMSKNIVNKVFLSNNTSTPKLIHNNELPIITTPSSNSSTENRLAVPCTSKELSPNEDTIFTEIIEEKIEIPNEDVPSGNDSEILNKIKNIPEFENNLDTKTVIEEDNIIDNAQISDDNNLETDIEQNIIEEQLIQEENLEEFVENDSKLQKIDIQKNIKEEQPEYKDNIEVEKNITTINTNQSIEEQPIFEGNFDKSVKNKLKFFNISKQDIELKEYTVEENDICTFSYIVSPSEFYIHLNDLHCRLTDQLTQEMNKSKTVKLKYKSKRDAANLIQKYCIVSCKSIWYRAEIVDWMMKVDSEIIQVHLVDFGCKEYCSFRTLQPISSKFIKQPKLAIRCHLASIRPQSLSDMHTEKWHISAIKAFKQLAGINSSKNKINFKINYVEKEGNSFGIHLHDEKSDENNTVAHKLIELGAVVCYEAVDDDSDYDDNLEKYDNINEAISGYDAQDEARICRFTNSAGKCYKGPKCKLDHIPFLSGFTTDTIMSYSEAFNKIYPPPVGIKINVMITGYISPCQFYVQILNSQMCNDKLEDLQKELNLDIVIKKYVPFKILPGVGELLLVLNYEKKWCRGKLRKCHNNAVEVFLVDYGETCITNLENIRKIKEEFLDLPFQAIECVLYNYQLKSDISTEEVLPFFEKYVHSKSFIGVNKSKKFPLEMQLSYLAGLDLGVFLQEYGIVEASSPVLPAVNSSITAE